MHFNWRKSQMVPSKLESALPAIFFLYRISAQDAKSHSQGGCLGIFFSKDFCRPFCRRFFATLRTLRDLRIANAQPPHGVPKEHLMFPNKNAIFVKCTAPWRAAGRGSSRAVGVQLAAAPAGRSEPSQARPACSQPRDPDEVVQGGWDSVPGPKKSDFPGDPTL